MFIPLAVESLGWHNVAVGELRKLGGMRHTGQEGEAISHLFKRLSILLVRGNAALVLNHIPGQLHPGIGGVI